MTLPKHQTVGSASPATLLLAFSWSLNTFIKLLEVQASGLVRDGYGEIQEPRIGSHIKLMILEDLPSLQEPLRVGNNSFYNPPPNTISGPKK